MGYGGYLNPFTNEAQVNGVTPKFRLPTVSCHEVGHQLGYSAEGATNFIGYLVTSESNDPYFKYSASKASFVIMSLGRMSFSRSRMTAPPAAAHSAFFSSLSAGLLDDPGRLIPMASMALAMVFAAGRSVGVRC